MTAARGTRDDSRCQGKFHGAEEKIWTRRSRLRGQEKVHSARIRARRISAAFPLDASHVRFLAIYVEDKIVLILRQKPTYEADNGVWLATTEEHHESLRREFPNMRSIELLGKSITGWQVLPVDAPDFEKSALHACELVFAGDGRIGKVPGTRRRRSSRAR